MPVFQFLDFNATDFSKLYPDIYPGIGSVWFETWAHFNPSQGVYDDSRIKAWIEAESKNKLLDGSDKPLMCFLYVHAAPNATDGQGVDHSPEWVKRVCPTIYAKDPKTGSLAKMPAYNNLQWWKFLTPAIAAFMKAVEPYPQIKFVCAAHGCDAELWPMKDPWNKGMPGGVERMFSDQTVILFDTYRSNSTKPLLARTTGAGRTYLSTEAIKKGIGIQMCGAQPAAENAHAWGYAFNINLEDMGSWDTLVKSSKANLPTVAETTFGFVPKEVSQQFRYWTLLGMIAACDVEALDCHPDWFRDLPAWVWTWAMQQMGMSATTSPTAWIVMHDYDKDYPPVEWTSSTTHLKAGQSDWQGNYERFIKMLPGGDAVKVEGVGPTGALESRQCRLMIHGEFAIDDAFGPEGYYKIKVRWLHQGSRVITINDGTKIQSAQSTGSETWDDSEFVIYGKNFQLTSTGAAIHKIEAVPTDGGVIPPEPDFEVMATALTQAEMDLEDAEQKLAESNIELNKANAHVVEANARLADVTTEIWSANTDVDSAKIMQASAQEQIDLCQEQLAIIRAEIEKAAKG